MLVVQFQKGSSDEVKIFGDTILHKECSHSFNQCYNN